MNRSLLTESDSLTRLTASYFQMQVESLSQLKTSNCSKHLLILLQYIENYLLETNLIKSVIYHLYLQWGSRNLILVFDLKNYLKKILYKKV